MSAELCGGTHVGRTGDIGLFKVTSESGVAAGVRRIEAVTGKGAAAYYQAQEARLSEVSDVLGATPENVSGRARQLLSEKSELEGLLDDLRSGGGAGETAVAEGEFETGGNAPSVYRAVRLKARDADDARKWGDAFLSNTPSGVAVVAAEFPGDKHTLFTFVTDDLIGKGIRADSVVREVASVVEGKGGGRPHMAQAGVGNATKIPEALEMVRGVVTGLAGQKTE